MDILTIMFLVVSVCGVRSVLTMEQACFERPIARHCEPDGDEENIFFNVTSGRCETLDWRVCTTGANSFSDWLDCYHACVCHLNPLPIPCGDFSDVTSMGNYYFSMHTQRCERFPEWHEGCTRNDNAFQGDSTCKMACVCSQPSDPGTCDGREQVFFFNSDSHRCEEFTYTGCGGNANRFDTEDQCKEQCLCGLPRAPADGEPQCMEHIPSVFYNSETQQCERFIYGGCGGNNNRFPSMSECYLACN